MRRLARFLTRITALRIGLAAGAAFALLHLLQTTARGGLRPDLPGPARALLEAALQGVERAEGALRDVKFAQRGRIEHGSDVTVVAIDEKAIARYGRFPWDRRVLAQLVDRLTEDGARAIGFDMAFSDEDRAAGPEADKAFADALARSGKVVIGWEALTPAEAESFAAAQLDEQARSLAAAELHPPEVRGEGGRARRVRALALRRYVGLRAPLPVFAQAARSFGFFNAAPDADGVLRSAILGMDVRGHLFPSLELALAAMALDVPLRRVVPLALEPDGGLVAGFDLDGKLFAPTDERGLLRIDYAGPDRIDPETGKIDRTVPQLSVADVLSGDVPAGALRGQVVLVAATAEGTFDQRNTPFRTYTPGVAVHANAVQALLDRRFLRAGVDVQLLEVAAAFALAVAFAFVFARVRVALALPVLLLSAAAVHFGSYAFFRRGYQVFEAVPLFEVASIFALVTVFRYATEERDKRQLRRAFQLYLNPDVLDEMLAQPDKLQLGGDERELTVLFSDIRGFTTLSEKLSPQALVHLLNEYLTPMTEEIFARRGTLDKYIGDAVMAFFGAPVDNPKHALHCCEAALSMMAGLDRLRQKWAGEPGLPAIDHGIGINTGRMVVGNMGSLQRFNYTVIGDEVNLASRLEGLNKEYGTHVLISESTLRAARKGAGRVDALAVRELDSVGVKGRTEPVRLFELRGLGKAPDEDRPLLDTYANGLALYRQRRFNEARVEFETCLSLAPDDGPSRLFVARCDEMVEAPPAQGWDGVFRMSSK